MTQSTYKLICTFTSVCALDHHTNTSNNMSSSQAVIEGDEQQGCFKLPAELRNRIYTLAVSEEDIIFAHQSVTRHIPTDRSTWIYKQYFRLPRFIHACRQLRDEALPLYFSTNKFATVYEPRLAKSTQNELAAKYITHIRCCLDLGDPDEDGVTIWMDVQVAENGAMKFSFQGWAHNTCMCELEGLLRRCAVKKVEEMGGQTGGSMGLAFGVAECLIPCSRNEHLAQVLDAFQWAYKVPTSTCDGCGKRQRKQ